MPLTFVFEVQGHIMFLIADYVGIHVKINLLQPIICEISCKRNCSVSLIYDIEGQD